jgi:hypothetical protein
MQTHKVMQHAAGKWVQVGAVEVDATGRSLLVLTTQVVGKLLLHPVTPVEELNKPTAYTDPPWDPDNPFPFDDELKF